MTRSEIVRYLVLRSIGNFLLLFAIFGIVATFGPSVYYEVKFRIAQVRQIRYEVPEEVKPSLFGELLERQRQSQEPIASELASVLTGPREQILIPKDTDFSILIPKIGATAKVYANVDPGNEKEFLQVLQKGVAHAKGSVFPGQEGNSYFFAHSTDNFWDVGRYNAVFYLLKDLGKDDDVVIFFENRRYNYTVSDSMIVDAKDVSFLVKSQEGGEQKLILQTCWPPGTTWKRLIIIASPNTK